MAGHLPRCLDRTSAFQDEAASEWQLRGQQETCLAGHPRCGAPVPELTCHNDIKLNPRVSLPRRSRALAFEHQTLPRPGPPKAKSSRQYIRRGDFVKSSATDASFHLKEQPDHETLDLIEMRRQLTALRSQHSDNLQIASLLNRFLVKIAFLAAPTDLADEQYLRSEFERVLQKVKEISARTKSD
jgi:hypothetical protein